MSTLTHEDGCLQVTQVAEKDQKFHLDGEVSYRVEEEGEVVVVRSRVGEVEATRRLVREGREVAAPRRRHSVY